MSMYIRVKRQKTTIFLHVEPTDTILEVKAKLQELLEQPPEGMQLRKLDDDSSVLEDARKLADLKVENGEVIAMCYIQEDGTFEPVNIESAAADKPL